MSAINSRCKHAFPIHTRIQHLMSHNDSCMHLRWHTVQLLPDIGFGSKGSPFADHIQFTPPLTLVTSRHSVIHCSSNSIDKAKGIVSTLSFPEDCNPQWARQRLVNSSRSRMCRRAIQHCRYVPMHSLLKPVHRHPVSWSTS